MLITHNLSWQLGNYPKSINASVLNDWFDSEREDPVLIDVREHSEIEIARFSKEFLHIPISTIKSEYVEEIFAGLLDREIVVTCHAAVSYTHLRAHETR